MTPFYDLDGITIYHADCNDIIPLVPPDSVGLLLTDPPYGMDVGTEWVHRISATTRQSWQRYGGWAKDHPPVHGDDEAFDPMSLLRFPRIVLFGANYYADKLPPSGGWIVWDKRRQGTLTPGWNGADAELAWTNVATTPKVFGHLWAGYKRDSELGYHVHPTQKPVVLMRWIVEKWTEPGDLVFDPYMGSGPVARACLDLGRRYIGVEIVEVYCQAAVDRLGQLVLPLGPEGTIQP